MRALFPSVVLIVCLISVFGTPLFAVDDEVEVYFSNRELLQRTINGAIQEGALAGFHGAINKADYFMSRSKAEPQNIKIYSFIAWWNLVNAHLILDMAATMPTNKRLPHQDTKTLISVMLKVDDMRYKIEKDVFKWNDEKSFKRFGEAFLAIKEVLGENPIKQEY
ncbi:MAG: hypothetical protein A4E65_00226 [Syntrophorhabdus sp. PtaU1.Bin153]|nr:MAG: hypothetical protein A4E65_00226 [Syntrophorhabdus sp. PtaU1.Bin153]